MSRKKANNIVYDRFSNWVKRICPDGDRSAVAKFANSVGVSSTMVRNWREGKYLPNTTQLLEIKDRYNISIDWLLTGDSKADNLTECDKKIRDLCDKVKEVIESNSHWGLSLESNINSFKSGLDNDRDLKELQKDVKQLKKGAYKEHLASAPIIRITKKKAM